MNHGRPLRLGPLQILAVLASVLVLLAVAIEILYWTVPVRWQPTCKPYVLLVLGVPTGLHGEPTEMQHWRVDEAVREFRSGVASHILFTGGQAANHFTESDTMAALAEAKGVPAKAIVRERSSRTTLENLRFSEPLLRANGWTCVEVISSADHLRRAAVFLQGSNLHWSLHAAPTPGRNRAEIITAYAEEAYGTAVLRVFGSRAEPVLHAMAVVQHWLAWCVRWVWYKLAT